MIYVTGDTHGELDRFKSRAARALQKGDSLIVCGDFGFVWDGSHEEQKRLHWLCKQRYRILFVEGTHDNLDRLAAFPEVQFCGGRAHHLGGNVYHLLRGEIYDIDEKRVFAFGGGESDDQDARIEGVNWWPGEMPTQEDLTRARENLRRCEDRVDLIITHQCSHILHALLHLETSASSANILGVFFDWVSRHIGCKCWYFGALHLDKPIPPAAMGVFREIHPVQ